jgi:hypothetical protein
MKENNNIEDDKNEILLKKPEVKPKIYRQTFPLGYQDKRERKYYKSGRSRKSKSSSKSASSESIEEKNEDLEDDDNFEDINNKSNNGESDNDSGNKNILGINDNLNEHSLNDSDSDSEIVEEEIITEEIIAQIYKNNEMLREKNNQDLNLNNNIITPIVPISESIIIKNEDNININENENKLKVIESKENKEKKEKIIKKKENILFKYFNHKSVIEKLRIITIIILATYISLTTLSIFIYIFEKEKNIIFCFEFLGKKNKEEKENFFFLFDRNTFFLIQLILSFPFISVINTLLRNEYLQLKHFFKEMSFYFPLTLILNMPIYIVGIFQNKYDDEEDPKIWTSIFFSLLTLVGFYSMINILVNVKRHKYKSISSLINISILSSFLAAFECYCAIYCVCLLIRSYFIKIDKINAEKMAMPEIIAGILFFSIGFFIIIAFKDIYFSFIVVIIEIGILFIRKYYSIAVECFNIMTTCLSYISIIITIFKYKKQVFGLSHVD